MKKEPKTAEDLLRLFERRDVLRANVSTCLARAATYINCEAFDYAMFWLFEAHLANDASEALMDQLCTRLPKAENELFLAIQSCLIQNLIHISTAYPQEIDDEAT